MTFISLSPVIRGFMILFTQCLCYGCVIVAVYRLLRNNSIRQSILINLPVALSFWLQIEMLRGHLSNGEYSRLSLGLILAAQLCFSVNCLLYLKITVPREERQISRESIRESFDSISTGLCYYWPEGMTKMVNSRMHEICRKLTGLPLSDGQAFWQQIWERKDDETMLRLQNGSQPICRLPDGTVYSFCRIPIDFEGHLLYELSASDITEEYSISERLKEKQQKADEINRRLLQLSKTIEQMTAEKELLDARIRLHDGIGQILLLMRAYIKDPSSVDGDQLASASRTLIQLLQNPGRDPADLLESCREKALELGVSLELEGSLPDDQLYTEVLRTAVMTGVLNLRQHADGDRLFIRAEKKDGAYLLRFTNNGKPPSGEIRESGGLRNLRKKVERVGGSMQIRSLPEIEILIRLPLL